LAAVLCRHIDTGWFRALDGLPIEPPPIAASDDANACPDAAGGPSPLGPPAPPREVGQSRDPIKPRSHQAKLQTPIVPSRCPCRRLARSPNQILVHAASTVNHRRAGLSRQTPRSIAFHRRINDRDRLRCDHSSIKTACELLWCAAQRRPRAGPFQGHHAIALDKRREPDDTPPAFPDLLLPVVTALADIPALALTEQKAADRRHGQAISLVAQMGRIPATADPADGLVRAMAGESRDRIVPLRRRRAQPGSLNRARPVPSDPGDA